MSRWTPTVSRLIEVDPDTLAVNVDQIGSAASVDVRQSNPLLVELVGVIEEGRVVHGNFGRESPVAEIGPIANFTVANPH